MPDNIKIKRNDRFASNNDELHPVIYKTIAGLVLWLIIAAWTFFDDHHDAGYLLAVVTGFLFMFMGLPTMLWLSWRHNAPDAKGARPAFHEWAHARFATWQGQLSGREAAMQALLPIAALAVGMTSIGIVFAVVSSHYAS